MLNKRNILIISLFCLMLMIIIPFTAAESVDNNQTINEIDQNEDVLTDNNADYYFNSSAKEDGDGSLENPYKYLTYDKVKDDSTIHLASGEYELNWRCDVNRVNIVGEDALNTIIKYDDVAFKVNEYLSLTNITLNNATILNYGSVDATNTVFCNGEGVKFQSGNSGGGAIYTMHSNQNSKVTINNCTFKDNIATYGGSIYMESGILEVYDSSFINNYAYAYGGAISSEYSDNIIIYKSKFIKNRANDGDGGAIYIEYCNQFKGSYCTFEDNSALCGGAVYVKESILEMYDSDFINNSALYGGAVWVKDGRLMMANDAFANNSAYNFGGAISCQNCDYVMISNMEFVNNRAFEDAGGAIYVFSSDYFNAENINITRSYAYYGGAITTLNTTSSIKYLNAYDNIAEYVGGAIYQMYCPLELSNSNFLNNRAFDGGALFLDNSTLTLIQNSFVNNTALNYGGAIYSLFNNLISGYSRNTFENNHASYEDDVFETNEIILEIGGEDYLIFKLNETVIGDLPSSYSMLDEGYLTPVKDQGDAGNCWAFTAMAVLESCIKKITGQDYDFSEENIKNIMAYFSDIGWNSETNGGGTNAMAQAYFASWLGPVNDSDDVYCEYSVLSPIFNSLVHVQNILFLSRDNYTDNDAVKKAIMKYGAVGSSLLYDDYFLNNFSYYVDQPYQSDHAVTIVGWDDNYSKYNFNITPEDDGAWLVKNSWGTDWGNNGFFYVSYYDRTLLMPGRYNEGYTFILNETVRFDKNYQYDIAGFTNFLGITSSSVSYKNIFTASDNEVLSAVSTYFIEETNWNVSIFVNGDLKTKKSGFSNSGYWTILLDDNVHLNKGDVFEVAFDVSINGDYVRIPVSTSSYLNKPITFENVSRWFNGRNWVNLSDSVICIKAFTIVDDIRTTLSLIVDPVSYNPVNVTAYVVDEYNNPLNGTVTFTLDGKELSADLVNGKASIVYIFEEGLNNISCLFNESNYAVAYSETSVNVNKRDTELTLDIIRNVNNLFINVTSKDNINGTIVLLVNNDNYRLNLVNAFASCNLTELNNGVYIIGASLESQIWKANEVRKEVTINIKNTQIIASDLTVNDEDLGNFSVTLVDEDGKSLSNKTVLIDGQSVRTDDNGVASIQIKYPRGKYSIDIQFNGDNDYYASNITGNVHVVTNIDAVISVKTYANTANISIVFSKDLSETIRLTVNGSSEDYVLSGAKYDVFLNDLSNGYYDVVLDLLSDDYNFTQKTSDFTINAIGTQILASDLTVNDEDLGNFSVTLVDEDGNSLLNKTVLIDGHSVRTDVNGTASIPINYERGKYLINIQFDGDEDYIPSNITRNVHVVTNIDAGISVTTYLDTANISIVFSKDLSETILLTVNDNSTEHVLSGPEFDVSLKDLSNGYYDVVLDLLSDDYNFTQKTSNFTINATHTQILASDLTVNDEDLGNFSVTLVDEDGNPLSNKTISIAGQSVRTDDNGTASIPINYERGKYSIDIQFDGDDDCLAAHVTRNVHVVTNIDAGITVNTYLDTANIIIVFSKDLSETIRLTVNDNSTEHVLSGHEFDVSLKDLSNGYYDVVLDLLSDDYNFTQKTSNFTINAIYTQILASDLTVNDEDLGNFSVTLVDENGNPLSNKTVLIAGQSVRTDDNGMASIPINYGRGKYLINITFDGDETYFKTSTSRNVFVKTNIDASISVNTLLYDANISIEFSRNINERIALTINDNTTDYRLVDGKFNISLKGLSNGEYTVWLDLLNDEYNFTKAKSDFTIRVIGTQIIAEDFTTTEFSGKSYTIKLIDEFNNPLANRQVKFNLDDSIIYVNTTNGGFASIPINLAANKYSVKITYDNSGDDYEGCEITKVIDVKISISAVISHTRSQNNVIIDVTFSKPINGDAVLLINNNSEPISIKDGKASLQKNNLANGVYSVSVVLDGDYALTQNPYEFTINVKQSKILSNPQTVYYHSGGVLDISLVDEDNKALANKMLNIVLNNGIYTLSTNNDGIVSLPVDDLGIGSYSVSISFNGDNDYFATSNSTTLTVISSISLPQNKYTLNSPYIVTFYDKNGAMVQKDVTVTLNNVVYNLKTDANGQVKININLGVGSYNVNVVNSETGEVKSQTIQVVARLSGNADISMYYGAGKSYTVRVFTDYGQVAKAGEVVTFKVAGHSYNIKTDSNGYASYKLTLKAGNYKITATYKGFTVSNKIVIKPTLITKDKKVKKGKKIKYEAKLLNTNGKALKGKKITFKIKGKTYKAKTNKKGIAKITIKNRLKVGKYKITAKYGKLTSTSKITIKK